MAQDEGELGILKATHFVFVIRPTWARHLVIGPRRRTGCDAPIWSSVFNYRQIAGGTYKDWKLPRKPAVIETGLNNNNFCRNHGLPARTVRSYHNSQLARLPHLRNPIPNLGPPGRHDMPYLRRPAPVRAPHGPDLHHAGRARPPAPKRVFRVRGR